MCVCVYTMCSSNYSAENTPHSFGPVLAIELSICGCSKKQETGKVNSLLDLGAQSPLFQLKLLLLLAKLEMTTRWNGFGLKEGTLGRAKQKHGGFQGKWLRAASHTIFYILPLITQPEPPGRCACASLHKLFSSQASSTTST